MTSPFEFMRRLKPAGILLCIVGIKGMPATPIANEAALDAWIERNRGENLYWLPNAIGSQRPRKTDIEIGHLLHVDIDRARDGTQLADDPAAKEAMIEELRADGFTAIVDSGGGLQGYVLLKQPIPREEIEARNRGLILKYAPHDLGTWNIDRLLRIPGTTNYPSEAKKEKGRVISQSSVVFADGDARDGIEFKPVHEREAKKQAAYKFGPVDIDDDQMPCAPNGAHLPASLIALIRDLDDSGLKRIGDGSNSSKARRAILLMLRHGLKPETIKGVCMSGMWALGSYFQKWCDDHQGADLEGEVERQITKAMGALKDYEADADAPLKDMLDSNKDEAWDDIEELPPELLPVPEFDYQLLPDAFRPYVEDRAELLQVPPEFIAVTLMAAAGNCIGTQCGIRPQRATDWVEVPNLWSAIIATPGAKKSPSVAAGLRPLKRLEALEIEAFELAQKELTGKLHEYELRKKAFEKLRIQRLKTDINADFSDIELPDAPQEPKLRRYIANNATVEALGALLADNPRGVLLERDELISLFRVLDREDKAEDRGFYLIGWNGKDSHTTDRIGRGRIHIKRVAIGIVGGAQPGPFRDYVAEAIKREGGDGLLARFGLLVWPDLSKGFKLVDRAPNVFARDAVDEVFQALDSLNMPSCPVAGQLPFLRFSADAQAVFDAWYVGWQSVIRSQEEHPAVVSHLSKYESLVPALALICALVDGERESVGLAALNRALAWAKFLEAHARRAYGSALIADVATAKLILNRIKSGKLSTPFKVRDLAQKKWAGLDDTGKVKAGIALLEDHGYLRIEEVKPATGGRASTIAHVNPAVMKN